MAAGSTRGAGGMPARPFSISPTQFGGCGTTVRPACEDCRLGNLPGRTALRSETSSKYAVVNGRWFPATSLL